MLTKLYVKAQGLLTRDEGATAVEYGIMVAAIAVAILVIVFTLGDNIAALFERVSTRIAGAGA